MRYGSTRGGGFTFTAPSAILQGIAPDGGLFVPDSIPDLSPVTGEGFISTAQQVFHAMLPGFSKATTDSVAKEAYTGTFSHPDIAPVMQVGDAHVLELFHGPTAAFKDVALCALPRMMAAAMLKTGEQRDILILTATSGDTGSAALSGFRDVKGTRIIVFYPENGVSPVQKAQMQTMQGDNLCVCGVHGNFDDAQSGVKQMFASLSLPYTLLSSANSINIGRLVPQMTYYFTAYHALVAGGSVKAGEPVNFVVPTGNFGDILAGYLCKRAGLPIGQLVCASNANDVLTDFFLTGIYDRRRPLHKTLSPSMDILLSSNLERLLYFESEGDTKLVAACMQRLAEEGWYRLPDTLLQRMQQTFISGTCSDREGLQTIRTAWQQHHYLMDPHTAAAYKVKGDIQRRADNGHPYVVLSTASPFKFPGAMAKALGLSIIDDAAAPGQLAGYVQQQVPQPLMGLQQKAVLHSDVIRPEDMPLYVQNKAVQAIW